MAQNPRKLKVVLTEDAAVDIEVIWGWNAYNYGVFHADGYIAFLRRESQKLERTYRLGSPVLTHPGLRYTIIRKNPRGHGHIVVYRVIDNQVELLHFFHTAQDWQNKL